MHCWTFKDYDWLKYLTLIPINEKDKDIIKNMKKFQIKLNITLSQIIITQMIMMKNLWKLELFLIMIYFKKKLRDNSVVILIRCFFHQQW